MKPEELRIGNYVSYKDSEEDIIKIDGITTMYVEGWINEVYDNPFLSEIKPIPLTEEWLIKFGFEYNSTHLIFEGKNEFIIDRDFGANEKFSVYIEMMNKDIVLEYIHQLQNLYYALVGEELTIKE